MKILLVNSKFNQCGVYQFGKTIHDILFNDIDYIEAGSCQEVANHIGSTRCDFVIYNHHPIPMGWLSRKFAQSFPSALLVHDFPQDLGVANIFPDPTYIENENNFKINRPIPINDITVKAESGAVGSFGFGFDHKGLPELINIAANTMQYPKINLHLPYNTLVDINGSHALRTAEKCRSIAYKLGLEININHKYFTKTELLTFLAKNAINCFVYENSPSGGVSSATDWAIAVGRPIAISHSPMFRHLFEVSPSIFFERGLQNIIDDGFEPIKKFTEKWTSENLLKDFNRIALTVLKK